MAIFSSINPRGSREERGAYPNLDLSSFIITGLLFFSSLWKTTILPRRRDSSLLPLARAIRDEFLGYTVYSSWSSSSPTMGRISNGCTRSDEQKGGVNWKAREDIWGSLGVQGWGPPWMWSGVAIHHGPCEFYPYPLAMEGRQPSLSLHVFIFLDHSPFPQLPNHITPHQGRPWISSPLSASFQHLDMAGVYQ